MMDLPVMDDDAAVFVVLNNMMISNGVCSYNNG
jgi:hypothetical protein